MPTLAVFQLYHGCCIGLADWCLMPTLAVFQLYHGCCIGLADWCLMPTLAVFQLYRGKIWKSLWHEVTEICHKHNWKDKKNKKFKTSFIDNKNLRTQPWGQRWVIFGMWHTIFRGYMHMLNILSLSEKIQSSNPDNLTSHG